MYVLIVQNPLCLQGDLANFTFLQRA